MAGGAVVALAGGVVSFVLSLFYQVVIARRLGPSAFGLLVLALAISKFVAEGSDVGLDYGVLRFGGIAHGAGDPGRFRAVLRSALWGSLLVGVALGAALAAGSELIAQFFGKPGMGPVLVPLALSVPLIGTTGIVRAALRAMGNAVRPVAATSLIGSGVRLLTGVWAVALVPSAPAVAWAYVATEAVVLLSATLMLLPLLRPADRQEAPVKKLYRFSIPMSLNRLLLYSNAQSEIVFLGFLAPAATVGVYGVARRLSALLTGLMASVSFLFLPIVADLHHSGRTRELDQMFKTSTRWLVTLALPVCLVEVLFAPEIMSIFGKGFSGGSGALIVLAIGQLVNVGTGTVAGLQAMAGYARLTLMNSVLFLSLSIVLDLLLIPWMGLLGAAIASTTSVVTINLVRLRQVRKNLGIVPYDRSFRRPFVAAVPAAAVAWFLPLPELGVMADLLIRTSLLSVVYIGALLVQGLEPIDRQIIRSARARLLGRRMSSPAADPREVR
jgi:O-antigen/teichoic acid export membrane protein